MSFRTRLKFLKYTWRQNRRIARELKDVPRAAPQSTQAIFDALEPHPVDVPFTRIGGDGDGGYVMPDDFEGMEASYSPGVSDLFRFDLEMAERGMPCYLADASVDGVATDHPNIHFEKLFLGAETAGEFISLQDWVNHHTPDAQNLLLQIDIEGAEYEVLNATPDDVLTKFRMIVIELHDLHHAFDENRYKPILETLGKLNTHFHLCHMHSNNSIPMSRYGGRQFPLVVEATYIRKDRCARLPGTAPIPHPLDQPNFPDNPDWHMPRIWNS